MAVDAIGLNSITPHHPSPRGKVPPALWVPPVPSWPPVPSQSFLVLMASLPTQAPSLSLLLFVKEAICELDTQNGKVNYQFRKANTNLQYFTPAPALQSCSSVVSQKPKEPEGV